MLSERRPTKYIFLDDGVTPNHPKWPVLIYRKAVTFNRRFKNAAVLDALFYSNGWRRSWRASIYDFLHYHSQVHEVLGVAQGHAHVQFGGVKGRIVHLKAGDVVVLPAGTGHQKIKASANFLVVGAYPQEGKYDECTDSRDRQKAKSTINKVKKPASDPVMGRGGPLSKHWSRKVRAKAVRSLKAS